MKSVLTIAGFDPSSGAGITADLMVFAAHGLFGTSAITALTVQSTVGVRSVHPVDAAVLRSTLDCLQEDVPPDGIKIGMLGTAGTVAVVCDYLDYVRATPQGVNVPVVLDPVLRSSSGRELLEETGLRLLETRLLPLVDWVTPNIEELSLLVPTVVEQRADVAPAARALQESMRLGSHRRGLGVFATGGHLEPPDDFLVEPEGDETWFPGVRLATRATHGTGCALSSAFLSQLVIGRRPRLAAAQAKEYVNGAMRTAHPIGRGRGPMNHLWDSSRSDL